MGAGAERRLGHSSDRIHAGGRVPASAALWHPAQRYGSPVSSCPALCHTPGLLRVAKVTLLWPQPWLPALTSCTVLLKPSGSCFVPLVVLGCSRVNRDANPEPGKQRGCQAELEVGAEVSCFWETGAAPGLPPTPFPCFSNMVA